MSWREEARAGRALEAEVEKLTSELMQARTERERAVEVLAREKDEMAAEYEAQVADLTKKVCIFILRLSLFLCLLISLWKTIILYCDSYHSHQIPQDTE